MLSSNYERGSRGGEIVETEQGIIDRDEIRHNFDVLSMYSDGLRKLFIVSIPLEYLCAPLTLILLYQLLTHPILFTSLHSQNAKTPECRTLIEEEFVRQLMAVTFEGPFPFEDIMFHSQCPSAGEPYQMPYLAKEPPKSPPNFTFPSRIEDKLDPETLSICYVLLVHDHPEFAMRLIRAILTPMNKIVIHVDRKAEPVYHQLKQWTQGMDRIIFVPIDECAFVNWGGFSVVNATLIGMHYALMYAGEFDYLADISGTSYPIKSNKVNSLTFDTSHSSVV